MDIDLTVKSLWLNATIQNNFVFGKTMELYPDLCRHLLELILDIKSPFLNRPKPETTISEKP